MTLAIRYEPLESISPYANNPRTHSAAQIKMIERSLQRFGWATPVGIADGTLIYGHARIQAARNLRNRKQNIPNHEDLDTAPVVDLSHLDDAERRAYVIADNQMATQAGWDDSLLRIEIGELSSMNFDLSLLGFADKDLTLLLNPQDENAPAGDMLELVNVTLADPTHIVTKGDHWSLAERHHLFCCSVFEDWPTYIGMLTKDALLIPYPGPLVLFVEKAATRVFVLVQPDEYAAGHILDRFCEVHGQASAVKVAA